MRFFPHEPFRVKLWPLIFLLAGSFSLSQEKGEPSHQERFAPPQEALARTEQQLDRGLAVNPGDAALLARRGLLRLQRDRIEDGLADLRQGAALQPSRAQSHVDLAYGLLLSRHPGDAAAEARKAIALDAGNVAAHAILGRVLMAEEGGAKEAIEHLQRSLELFPPQPDLRFDLITALRKEKDFAAAGVQLRILKDSLPPGDPRLEYAQGALMVDLGYPEAAAASFRRVLANNPSFLPARQDLAASLVQAGRWNEAVEALAVLAKMEPKSYVVAYMNALALENSSRLDAAEREARRAVALDEKSADARTLLGTVLSSQGRHADAVSELTRAVEMQPASFDAQLYLGRARYAMNDTAGAAQALREAVKLRPQDPEAHFFLGTVLEIAGDPEGAKTQYEELQRLRPRDPRGYVGMGSILGKYGNNEEALQQLQRARELDPENFEANMAFGKLLAKQGKFDDSLQFLRKAASERPESPEAHYQLALSLKRAGQNDEAAREFAQVERLNKERRSGSSGMGTVVPQ